MLDLRFHQDMRYHHRHGNAQKAGSAGEGVRAMRAAIPLAQEVGEGLGRGEVLLGSMPRR